MDNDWDVVIVGGGAAGIAAARRLATSGLSTVLLEASQRIGGRACTSHIAGHALDLGCGWLHSADRNPWVEVAEASGFFVDRGTTAWGRQYRNLGFSSSDQAAANDARVAWQHRLPMIPPSSDRASDALEPNGEWNSYLQAVSGYISGAPLDRLSAADYLAYEQASTWHNWRVPAGYGTLVAASLPRNVPLHLSTPVESIELGGVRVVLATRGGNIAARSAILTVSTNVIAGDAIRLPAALDDWRNAAAALPLGRDEKLFIEILGEGGFEPETHVIGDPRDPRTASYYIRPLGHPVIECFFGGEGAQMLADTGPVAAFTFAIDQLAALFGSDVRRNLRPLVASNWSRTPHIGGAYSYAIPGRAKARDELARPFDQRVFFAGEATQRDDFSTAHGAYQSGLRAAEEVVAALGALKRIVQPSPGG